jgi:hypothetical protein
MSASKSFEINRQDNGGLHRRKAISRVYEQADAGALGARRWSPIFGFMGKSIGDGNQELHGLVKCGGLKTLLLLDEAGVSNTF